MTILGQPEKYSEILSRVFWGHFVFALLCMAGLAQASPWVTSFVDKWQHEVSLGAVDGLKAGGVVAPLLIALVGRIIQLHDRISDIVRLREHFDVEVILRPLISGVGLQPDEAGVACVRANRDSIMVKTFYRYASFENPVIDSQLVRSAADRWGWFWTFLEPIPTVLLTSAVLLWLGSALWTWFVGLAVLLMLVCTALWRPLKRGAADEVEAILDDHDRRLAIAEVLVQVCSVLATTTTSQASRTDERANKSS
ncbi:MAG: hypothetical protein AMXMBFR57_37380 [Acidimicrobiia bacterium]|jgi:hypothetical protein